jgi:hypothetical protein
MSDQPFIFKIARGFTPVLALLLICSGSALAQETKNPSSFWDGGFTQAKSGQWFWDNGYTNAKSGVEGDLKDAGNSDGKSGLKPPSQWFFIPPERYFENVDPNEIDENRKKSYTPYALAMISQNVNYHGIVLSKGYYQVKLGTGAEGSPKTNLQALSDKPPKAQETGNFNPAGLPQYAPPSNPNVETLAPLSPLPSPENTAPTNIPTEPLVSIPDASPTGQILIFKKLGNVVAVLPVERIEPYKRAKGEKKAKMPLARVTFEQNKPVLKLLYKDKLYMTDLSY